MGSGCTRASWKMDPPIGATVACSARRNAPRGITPSAGRRARCPTSLRRTRSSIERSFGLSLLPLHRPPADVAAAEALRPVDTIDGFIGAVAGLGDGLAERGHREHPST